MCWDSVWMLSLFRNVRFDIGLNELVSSEYRLLESGLNHGIFKVIWFAFSKLDLSVSQYQRVTRSVFGVFGVRQADWQVFGKGSDVHVKNYWPNLS